MVPEDSVLQWFDQLRQGDPAAAQALWERYFAQLVRLARNRLSGLRRGARDEEDVALSAFSSFCLAAERGRFPQLADRDGLWRLLVALTERKAVDLIRAETRAKRGGGHVLGESGLVAGAEGPGEGGLDQAPGREPTPEFVALMAEECQRRLAQLGDETLRTVALLRLEGYSNQEVAERLSCTTRTVERKLELIRAIWQPEASA